MADDRHLLTRRQGVAGQVVAHKLLELLATVKDILLALKFPVAHQTLDHSFDELLVREGARELVEDLSLLLSVGLRVDCPQLGVAVRQQHGEVEVQT